jgi:hypothetical protein
LQLDVLAEGLAHYGQLLHARQILFRRHLHCITTHATTLHVVLLYLVRELFVGLQRRDVEDGTLQVDRE